jgi:hypothetical protein
MKRQHRAQQTQIGSAMRRLVDPGIELTLRRTQHLDVLGRELRRIDTMLGVSLPVRTTVISLSRWRASARRSPWSLKQLRS